MKNLKHLKKETMMDNKKFFFHLESTTLSALLGGGVD